MDVAHLDWLAGLLGCAGAVALAAPMLSDTRDRKYWEQLNHIIDREDAVSRAKLAEYREQFLDERLGNYRSYRRASLVGLALIGLAFLVLTVSGFLRLQ